MAESTVQFQPDGDAPVEPVNAVSVADGAPRFVADNALCIPVGRDFEVAFLAAAPQVVGQTQTAQGVQFSVGARIQETARGRFNAGGALAISMAILQRLIETGGVDRQGLVEAINAIADPDSGSPEIERS